MSPVDAEVRRRLAAELFNEVWELVGQARRTREQDDRMLHAAHASRLHWGEVGTAVNVVRGEWQCSRVYAVLGRPEPALHHARRCLELCVRADDAADFDLPFAYEALARAHAVAGETDDAERWRSRARKAGERIAEAADRELFLEELATVPRRKPARPA